MDKWGGKRRRSPARSQPVVRLHPETLEDRIVPAITITDFTAPTSGNQGALLVFSATATTTDSAGLTYTWDFGDNQTAEGDNVTHAFGAPTATDPRTVRLVVSDGTSQAEDSRLLDIFNLAPQITLDPVLSNIYSGDSLPFTASASDPGGVADPLTVDWDFNYDGTFDADPGVGATLTPSYTFNTAGSIVVATRATDASGEAVIATRSITVAALPTVEIAADDDAPLINQPASYYLTFDGDSSGFTSVAWDLNYDGTTFVADASATDWWVNPTFTTAGSRTIAARTTDAAGQQVLATLTFDVSHPPPDLSVAGDLTVDVGSSVTLAAIVGDPSAITDVEWWFSYEGMDYESQPDLTELSQSYTFADYGDYDVWVIVTDNHNETSEAVFHVTVNNVAPTADSVSVNGPIDQFSAVTFTVDVNDANILDVVTVSADWMNSGQFDDIDTALCVINENGSFSFDHVYELPGTYSAKVRLEDESGASAVYDVTVQVAHIAVTGTLTTDSSYSWNTSAGRTWLIDNNNSVWFDDVSAPDEEQLEYHFVFAIGSAPGVEIITYDPWCSLPSYAKGTEYTVTGWIKNLVRPTPDADDSSIPNPRSADQTIRIICGSYSEPITGKLTTDGLSDDGRSRTLGIASDAERIVTFTLDPVYRKIWPTDVPAHVFFHVTVYDTTPGWLGAPPGGVIASQDDYNISLSNGTGSVTLPGYANDRVIFVSGWMVTNESPSQTVGLRASVADNPNSFPVHFGANGGFYHLNKAQRDGMNAVTMMTNRTPTLSEQISNAITLAQNLAAQFSANADALFAAIKDKPLDLINNLVSGMTTGLSSAFTDLASPSGAIKKLLEWLSDGMNIPSVANISISDPSTLTNFFLDYAGLTWDKIKGVIQSQIGAGNYAAAEKVFSLVSDLDGDTPTNIVTFLQDLPNRLTTLAATINAENGSGSAVDFSDIISSFSWSTLAGQLVTRARAELTTALTAMIPRLLAKFNPAAGALVSIYDGFSFLINNSQQLGDFFTGIVNTMGDLAASVNNSDPTKLVAFSNGVKNTVLNQGLNVLLNFAASQLGLGGLKQSVKNVVQFIPNTVDALLRRIVSAVATRITSYLPGSGTSGLYAGLVGSVKSFTYQGQAYTLWVAKPSSGPPQVKIAQGTNLVTVLTANMLDTSIRADSRAHFAYVTTMANLVRQATTPRATATAITNLMAALTTLEGDITGNACVALSQGCFSAGTKLWSPIGYRAIEDFREGEPIYARNEFDSAGPVEVKMVEATFTRNAAILHLHVASQIIRTTGEHPFFAYDKGWTKAAALVVGDRLLTADGSWQLVEDILDTGEWETVYNLRVAEYHTYFVGDYSWGWALWAHNSYVEIKGAAVAGVTEGKYFNWTEGAYSAVWFVPTAFLTPSRQAPNQAMKDKVARDIATSFGNTLQTKVNDLRTAWNGLLKQDRYGNELPRVQTLLAALNVQRVASGGTTIDLDDYDNLSLPDPTPTTSPTGALGTAWAAFKTARAIARGNVLHHQLDTWIGGPSGPANGGYHPTGPDIDEHGAGPTNKVWYEVYPADSLGQSDNRRRHANRPGMGLAPWREIVYGYGR